MLKHRIVRHRYLHKLLMTLILILVIPLGLCLYLLLTHSYQELENKNLHTFQKINDMFSGYIESELTAMRSQAMSFAVKSRSDITSVPSLNMLKSNPYYYKKITEALSTQSDLTNRNLILYYKPLDSIFTSQHRYSKDEYLSVVLSGNQGASRILNSFFDYDASAKWRFTSTFPVLSHQSAVFYIGIPIKIGVDYQDALLIYTLSSGSINTDMFLTQSAADMDFLIYNEDNTLLYTNAPCNPELIEASNILSAGKSRSQMQTFSDKGSLYSVFLASHSSSPLKCIGILTSDSIQADTRSFYIFARNITLCMFAILMIFVLIVVYYNYMPILQLVRKITHSNSIASGELETIEGEFVRMRDELEEKNLLIIESLMSNLLYGAIVPQKLFETTHFYEYDGSICVYLIKNIRLDAARRAQLLEQIRQNNCAEGYLTDILYEDYSVLICLVGDMDPETIQNTILSFLKETLKIENTVVFTGDTVLTPNDIHKSYQSCLLQMNKMSSSEENSTEKDIRRKEMLNQVLTYISENISYTGLSQTFVADQFSMSAYSLSRLFREQLGIGYSEYITARRMDNAKRMLLTTSMKISDIAQSVGFADAKYFSRIFKANMGVTPNEFRNDPSKSF